eukprot:EG_transcript_6023
MLRKKFSNDNVAESCAEAIARFDLQAVEWLQDVREPNKIQLAFLAIISLLTEVKPYIPDQLLSRLTAKAADADADGSDSDPNAPAALPAPRLSTSETPDRRRSSYRPLSDRSRTPSIARVTRRANQSIVSSEASQVIAMKDWRRKRCTYMCVRFGTHHPNADRRLPELVRAAGQVVDISKAHGATIDSVGVDLVNVHWGVANASTSSAVRAVQAALEITTAVRAALPEDQQAAFWLQASIGKGLCDCGTVSSASGHRFFVVWGPEATLAIEVATANLPDRRGRGNFPPSAAVVRRRPAVGAAVRPEEAGRRRVDVRTGEDGPRGGAGEFGAAGGVRDGEGRDEEPRGARRGAAGAAQREAVRLRHGCPGPVAGHGQRATPPPWGVDPGRRHR